MDKLELRHLRYFVALAGELHFGRAAEALRVSQPLLSRQVREVERLVGVALLARTRPNVELTSAGKKFFEHAQLALQQTEGAVRAARAANGNLEVLAIAFEPCTVFHGFTLFVARLKRSLPDVHLDVRELPVSEHVHRLRTGDIDIAYAHRNEDAAGVEFTSLGWEPLLLTLPARHKLARRKRLPLTMFAGEPFIFWHRPLAPACHDYVFRLLSSHGLEPRARHQASDHQKSLEMVGAGLGWTLAPACARRVRQPGVVFREIEGITAKVEVGISRLESNTGRKMNLVRKLWLESVSA